MADSVADRTDGLLEQAAGGDSAAVQQLLELHRSRLKRMVLAALVERITRQAQNGQIVDLAPGRVFYITFSSDGKALAPGVDNGSVRIWDTATAIQRLEIQEG